MIKILIPFLYKKIWSLKWQQFWEDMVLLFMLAWILCRTITCLCFWLRRAIINHTDSTYLVYSSYLQLLFQYSSYSSYLILYKPYIVHTSYNTFLIVHNSFSIPRAVHTTYIAAICNSSSISLSVLLSIWCLSIRLSAACPRISGSVCTSLNLSVF